MGKWFFDKPCEFYIVLDVLFWFPSSEMHFGASCGIFLAQKSKMAIFQAKIGIFELNLALFVGFCQNMHPSA